PAASEPYGPLSPRRDNVILVCHALSGDAHAAGFSKTPPEEGTRDGFGAEDRDGTAGKGLGWWDGMIGPGKAFDTDRYFVVSTNLRGADGRPRHVLVRTGAERQVRPAAPVRRRHPLHDHRPGVRGRELPASPGRLVRQAVRRQHLSL